MELVNPKVLDEDEIVRDFMFCMAVCYTIQFIQLHISLYTYFYTCVYNEMIRWVCVNLLQHGTETFR